MSVTDHGSVMVVYQKIHSPKNCHNSPIELPNQSNFLLACLFHGTGIVATIACLNILLLHGMLDLGQGGLLDYFKPRHALVWHTGKC